MYVCVYTYVCVCSKLIIVNVTYLNLPVRLSVGRLVSLSVIISQMEGKLHFLAPIGEFVEA